MNYRRRVPHWPGQGGETKGGGGGGLAPEGYRLVGTPITIMECLVPRKKNRKIKSKSFGEEKKGVFNCIYGIFKSHNRMYDF